MTTKKASPHLIKRMAARFALHGFLIVFGTGAVVAAAYFVLPRLTSVSYSGLASSTVGAVIDQGPPPPPPLDSAGYNARLLALAHIATSSVWYLAFMQGTTTPIDPATGLATTTSTRRPLWPAHQALPADGRALLPFNRIVAYYGNFYSTGMGILGQYDEATVLARLKEAVAEWQAADPSTPVVPAIEYIDVTAQGSAGKDGKYRARMPDSQVDKAIEMAKKVDGIVVLDIQVGLSTVQDEVPLLDKYWAMPQVSLALDPEFDMPNNIPPGHVIGTMDAKEINYAINYLSDFVIKNNLPPKILVVHRFTEDMVTNYQNIKPTPQVQVVVQMDGWGFPAKKINTYNAVVYPEPVQFTGLKLFYKNDLTQTPSRLLTPQEVLGLTPSPIYIQYQ